MPKPPTHKLISMLSMGILVSCCLLATANAFICPPQRGSTSMRLPSFHLARSIDLGTLRMADGDGDKMATAEETAERLREQASALRASAAASEAELRPPSDDVDAVAAKPTREVRPEDMPPKRKISDDMKRRLTKELVSQGADPNKSAGNPILIVAGIIAILVVVGGQGILY